MSVSISRRSFISGSAAALALAGGSTLVLAGSQRLANTDAVDQPVAVALPVAIAQPVAWPTLPELLVTASAAGLSIPKDSIASGRYAVTFENQTSSEFSAAFMLVPEGRGIDDFNDALDAAIAEEAPPPEWYFTATAPGGLSAQAGTTARFVIDLPPGDYAVHPDTPVEGIRAILLSVTGALPADLPAIDADVTIGMAEMAFEIQGHLQAGGQTVAFVNTGGQSHHTAVFSVPDGTTIEDFETTMTAMMQGSAATPPEGALTLADLIPVASSSVQSPGTTMWGHLELEPATLLLICGVFDTETGAPHAMLGMADVVIVE